MKEVARFLKYRIKRARTLQDFDKFATEFKKDMGYEVPASFLRKGKLWVVVNPEGEFVGGYALVDQHPLRSLEEVPETYPLYLDLDQVGEVTAVWLKDKFYGLPWSLHFVFQTMIHPLKYWVYSYPISEVQLGKYYAAGDPVCIYKGPIVRLEGHPENPEDESVELLTAMGVAKIALHRNLKHLKKTVKKWLT